MLLECVTQPWAPSVFSCLCFLRNTGVTSITQIELMGLRKMLTIFKGVNQVQWLKYLVTAQERQRKTDLNEFEVRLIYIENSRPGSATQAEIGLLDPRHRKKQAQEGDGQNHVCCPPGESCVQQE